MKKAYLSATLTILCFATLGTCVTALAASRSDSPLIASYTLSTVPQTRVTAGRRSLPMLQAILGQWTGNGMRHASNPGQTAQADQAYQTARTEQTAMQTPLNWLNAMTLKLTANRHVLAEFLNRTGQDLSSEWMSEKDRSQPQK